MDIKQEITWINGFLDSLLNSDDISEGQIKVLKSKFASLITKMEDKYLPDKPNIKSSSIVNKELRKKLEDSANSSSIDAVSDLPF